MYCQPMPAPLPEEIKEKAKLLTIAVGPREAARQLGLKEDTVCYWSAEYGWAKDAQTAQNAVLKKYDKQGVKAASSKSPSDILLHLGPKSKLLGAKVGHSMLKSISKEKGLQQVALAQPFSQVVGSLSKIHSWDAQAPSLTQVNVNLYGTRIPDA